MSPCCNALASALRSEAAGQALDSSWSIVRHLERFRVTRRRPCGRREITCRIPGTCAFVAEDVHWRRGEPATLGTVVGRNCARSCCRGTERGGHLVMSVGSSDPAVVGGAHPDAVTGVDWHLPRRTAAANALVAIPAYNEERFIGSVVLRAGLLGFDVLVVDDGSADRTAQIARCAGAIVEVHAENRGKSAALNTAFRLARERGVSILVVMDGDAQHDADEIARFLTPVREGLADIVVGSRFLAASGGQIPGMRRLGQRAMTTMTNVASGISVSDSQSGFRGFSAQAIETLVFGSSGFSVEVEMQFQARDHGLTVTEVPISANYYDPPKRNVVSHGMQVLDGILRLVGQRRPLLF